MKEILAKFLFEWQVISAGNAERILGEIPGSPQNLKEIPKKSMNEFVAISEGILGGTSVDTLRKTSRTISQEFSNEISNQMPESILCKISTKIPYIVQGKYYKESLEDFNSIFGRNLDECLE